MAGNRPSGSAPERVNSSVWQMPVALISTSTSPARGPSSCTVVTSRGLPGPNATAARTSMGIAIIRKDWIVGGRWHQEAIMANPESVAPELEFIFGARVTVDPPQDL